MVKKKERKPEDELRKLFLTNFLATVIDAVIKNRQEEAPEMPSPKGEIREEKIEIFQEVKEPVKVELAKEEQEPMKVVPVKEEIKPIEKFAKVGKSQDLQISLTRNLKIPVVKTNYSNFSIKESPSLPEKMFPSIANSEELNSANAPVNPRTMQPIKIPGMQLQPKQESIPKVPSQKVIGPVEPSPFERIRPFISNPGITSIECPGPGKNIIIRYMGGIRTIPMALSEREIDDIIKQVSQRTKIPVIKGVFRAAVDNFVMTAIVSEFAGARFYIEKVPAAHYAQFPMRQ